VRQRVRERVRKRVSERERERATGIGIEKVKVLSLHTSSSETGEDTGNPLVPLMLFLSPPRQQINQTVGKYLQGRAGGRNHIDCVTGGICQYGIVSNTFDVVGCGGWALRRREEELRRRLFTQTLLENSVIVVPVLVDGRLRRLRYQ